jgi:8-oxo-dGTP pyrophosphatase MutT (NUDIX family)
VVAAFASVTAYRGSLALGGDLPHAMETLLATSKPVALVALGNPYLLRSFPAVAAYLATFSSVPVSEAAAVRALWGEIGIRGHLPVSLSPAWPHAAMAFKSPAARPRDILWMVFRKRRRHTVRVGVFTALLAQLSLETFSRNSRACTSIPWSWAPATIPAIRTAS